MGAFVANVNVRNQDAEAVQNALQKLGAATVRVSEPVRGWITVCEERASTQDEEWIEQLTRDVSARLDTACVAFLVHDSDIARYWLCDKGQLLDLYNSMPDYFENVSKAEKQRLRGKADVFLRYCRPGITREQVEAVLRTEVTFAEETVQQLAEFLGIEPDRALHDFNHDDDDDGGGFDGDGGFGSAPGQGAQDRVAQMLQQQLARLAPGQGSASSPQSDALVAAAATGNVAEIDRLVAAGVDVNAPGQFQMETIGGPGAALMAGMMPKVQISPLMAAASKGETKAVERLLALGADAKALHPIFGSALHAAAQKGSPEIVRLLLAAGVPADLKNTQGHTPRAILQALRNQVEMTRNLVKTMPQLQKAYDQFLGKMAAMNLPEEEWNACDALLSQASGV